MDIHRKSPQMHMHRGLAKCKSVSTIFPTPLSSYTANMTFEKVNEDGSLPIVDPRVVLFRCEASGKIFLIGDTFVGNSFQNTPLTEGADQMEISVTTAANWECMNEAQKTSAVGI